MKYAINQCFGGFGLSQEAYQWLIDNKNWKVYTKITNPMYKSDCDKLIEDGYKLFLMDIQLGFPLCGPVTCLLSVYELSFRSNPDVIECIENLKEKANSRFADIKIIETDNDVNNLEIHEYDGNETLQTKPTRFN